MEEFDPIARIEYFLEAVLNCDPAPFEPFARAEFYLAYLCGSAVTLPTPQSRVDYYLAYKCGEDVEIPDPIERIDFYLAKWCGYDCETPDPIHPIEYYLNALANNGVVETVTGNPISVSDALAKPAESLTIEILPQQSGSGDPSPDNVRPITGFTGVNIYRESAYDPDADPTYSISWQDSAGTVYGGELDVTSGVLTVSKGYIDLVGGNEATYSANGATANTSRALVKISGKANGESNMISNMFHESGLDSVGNMSGRATSNNVEFYLPTTVSQTAEDIKAWFASNNTQVAYELATPQTIQLTPTQVDMLLGNNTIWNDVGDMTLEYLADGPAEDIDALQILLGNRYVNNGEPDEATDREALDILLGGNTR